MKPSDQNQERDAASREQNAQDAVAPQLDSPAEAADSQTAVEPQRDFTHPARYLQLRLRTLLLLLTLASLFAWWFLYHPNLSEKNVEQLSVLRTLDENIWKVAWSPDGRTAAFIGFEQPVEIRDVVTWTKLAEIGGNKVIHFAFSPQPGVVAYCENPGQPMLVDQNRKTSRVLSTVPGQHCLAFSPDGTMLATGRYGQEAFVWDVASGKRISRLKMQDTGGLNLDFHPDGKLIAVGNRNGSAYVFHAKSGRQVAALTGGRNCHRVAFSPGGQILAVAYADGMLRTWDTKNWRLIKAVQTRCSDLYKVNWSKRGDMLVTCGLKGDITIWRPNLSVICRRRAPDWVIVADFTPDGARLLTAGGHFTDANDREVSIWGVPNTAAVWPLQGP